MYHDNEDNDDDDNNRGLFCTITEARMYIIRSILYRAKGSATPGVDDAVRSEDCFHDNCAQCNHKDELSL